MMNTVILPSEISNRLKKILEQQHVVGPLVARLRLSFFGWSLFAALICGGLVFVKNI